MAAYLEEFHVGDKVEVNYYEPPRRGTVVEASDEKGVLVRYDDRLEWSEVWIDCSTTPRWISKIDILF